MLDDPLSAQNAYSAEIRQNVIRSYELMFSTRLNNPVTAQTLMIGQRLHTYDLAGHLIAQGFPTLSLAFEAEEDEDREFEGVPFTRRKGDILQPGRLNIQIKNTKSPNDWAAQYQQRPLTTLEAIVKRQDLPFVDAVPGGGEVFVSWDTASSTKVGSSYSVGLVFRRVGDASYLINVVRRQVTYDDLVPLALDIHALYRPAATLIENAGVGSALASELEKAGANVIRMPLPHKAKIDRLSAELHHLRIASVKILRDIPGAEAFIDEVTAFPNGSNDDQVDALSQYLSFITEREASNQEKVFIPIKPFAGPNTKAGQMERMRRATTGGMRTTLHAAWNPLGGYRKR